MKVGTLNEAQRISWIEQTLKKIPKGRILVTYGFTTAINNKKMNP